MASVNLYNADERAEKIENQRGAHLKTLFFSLGLVVLALGSYGGVRFWETRIDKALVNIADEIDRIQKEMTTTTSQDLNEVFDTYLRLKGIGEASKPLILKSLAGIEQNILEGVLLSDYEYGGELGDRGIVIKGDAKNADTLLQQVKRFRSVENFADVDLQTVGLSKEGYVLFTMKFNFKE